MDDDVRTAVTRAIEASAGILDLNAALVARDWIAPGRRLGLTTEQETVGERGFLAERWLGSTTHADNAVGPEDEGISYIRPAKGDPINLAEAISAAPELILGAEYAASHHGLERLAKIYDFDSRIPFHIHPPLEQAKRVGRNSKDEACYFPPGVPLGSHPESFMGLHPSLGRAEVGKRLVHELEAWDSDAVLGLAPAYINQTDDGYYVPSGVLHAPGTALTIELQEDSDTLAMLQALGDGGIIKKDLLFKDISAEDRASHGEAALLDWIDWDENTDPYFYENHHTAPRTIIDANGVNEAWIFYGTTKFSGKRLILAPGARYTSTERGVFNILVWRGQGTVGGRALDGGVIDHDEVLIVHDRAVQPIEYVNTGGTDLLLIKFFGPDLNPDAPTIARYRPVSA
jgi:hypothetical protein